jgi:drug/metabolite transporter (DMT)-like permease
VHYIILTILTSVFLLVLFKVFEIKKVNTLQAIVINYIVAAITGILFSKHELHYSQLRDSGLLIICVPLGLLFISIFYLISLTAQKVSISAASVANKMSVVMPVLFSVFVIGDQLNPLKIAGIVLALIAVFLTTKSENSARLNFMIWLPILVFVGSGFIDITINAAEHYFLKKEGDSELFSIATFASAFCFGMLFLAFSSFKAKHPKQERSFLKSLAGGICLGIPNYFSIFFMIKSLETDLLSSAQLFPLLNISNVTLSALVAYLFFKEKLSTSNLSGIALAILSIILIAV